MLPLLFRTQPHASLAGGCVDLSHSSPENALHDHTGPHRAGAPAFATVLEGAVSSSATPPLAPWPLPAAEGWQQRQAAPAAAETRIDRDRRDGSRRRRQG